jgi:EAL domain-containing protein (putative c-di-GMP-specific phosphodiesterase class I)
LRYLQRLRLEIMKIDRSFVAEMATSRSSFDLVAAVAAMGTTLGLQIVAEGIETVADLRMLQHIHCELGQGYLFSVPVPITDIEQLVAVDHTYAVVAGSRRSDQAQVAGAVA